MKQSCWRGNFSFIYPALHLYLYFLLISLPQTAFSCGAETFQSVVFSGIQPTGVPHLGNYLEALREWVKLQNDAPEDTKFIFSIVDLHAIAVPQNSEQLRKWKRQTLAALLAIGLNPNRSIIFYQSAVCRTLTSRVAQYINKYY